MLVVGYSTFRVAVNWTIQIPLALLINDVKWSPK